MSLEDNATVVKLIEFFKSDYSVSKVNKKVLQESVKTFRQCTQEVGLSNEQIFEVAEIAAAQKYDEQNCCHLIYSLLPKNGISEDTILMIISKVCADVQSLKIKTLLLRWIILVYDLISSKMKLHCTYGILFQYIQNDTLSPYICHLLYFMTQKADVTHYRIARLLELQRRVGSQSYLSGLLSVYRMYRPSLICMAGTYKVFFKSDKLWENRLLTVQQKYGLNLLSDPLKFSGNIISNKEKIAQLPKPSMVHEFDNDDQPLSDIVSGRVPLHQIKSFQNLLNNIGRLDLSCQAFTLFSSKSLQHILAISDDRAVALRLSYWIHHMLNKELLAASGETKRGMELLEMTSQFTFMIQECLSVCEDFLFRYLWTWNGKDYRNYIFKMITRLRIMPFQELHVKILTPLWKLYILSMDVYFKCSIISTLSHLFTNYVGVELFKHKLAKRNPDNDTIRFFGTLFHDSVDFDFDSTVSQLIHFVDDLFAQSVQTVENKTLLLFYVLEIHLQASNIFAEHAIPLVVLPSPEVLIHSLFSFCASNLLLMLRILNNHIKTMTALQNKSKLSEIHSNTKALKLYCVDVFDALWRRCSFHPRCQTNSVVFSDLNEDFLFDFLSHPREFPPSRAFSIDRHPALICFTKQYLKIFNLQFSDLEEAKFVLDDSYMEFLKSIGLQDLTEFLQLVQAT